MFEQLLNEVTVNAIRMIVTIYMILVWIMVVDIVWELNKRR